MRVCSPPKAQSAPPQVAEVSGGVNVDAGRDVNVGGDVVGRDKIIQAGTYIEHATIVQTGASAQAAKPPVQIETESLIQAHPVKHIAKGHAMMPTQLALNLEPTYTWHGQPAQRYDGKLASSRQLPHFQRIRFDWHSLDPHTDLIVRKPARHNWRCCRWRWSPNPVQTHPTSGRGRIPAVTAQPDQLDGTLVLSEYGERMHLRVVVPNHDILIQRREALMLEVHCFNSVDRSMALQVWLGWYRLVCSNGLYFSAVSRAWRAHTTLARPLNCRIA